MTNNGEIRVGPITGLSHTQKQQMVHGFLTTHYIGSILTCGDYPLLIARGRHSRSQTPTPASHEKVPPKRSQAWKKKSSLRPVKGGRPGNEHTSSTVWDGSLDYTDAETDAQTSADPNVETNAETNVETNAEIYVAIDVDTDVDTVDDNEASGSQLPCIMSPEASSSKCHQSKTPVLRRKLEEHNSNDNENSGSGDGDGNVPEHHKYTTAKRSKVEP
ncbi:hypothetical protein BKA83DRAFT_4130836 [Pisolithus microcarpus]|nr:hypothetical protein BKA83DRAFT_4130836 [Pisolithus microcarpus]